MNAGSASGLIGWQRDLGIAIAASFLAVAFYFFLGPDVFARTPLVPYLVTVFLAGCFSARAAAATIVISATALATALPPIGIPLVVERADQIVLAMFVATASGIGLIFAVIHRGRHRIQKQADALRSAEHSALGLNRRFQIALEAGRMIAWDWDLSSNSILRSENAFEMFGVRDGPLADFLVLVDPEDRPRLESAIQTAIKDRTGYECEYRARRADGTICWLADRARVVIDPISGRRHLAGAAVDITERVRLEEQLRSEHRQKDIFLAMLAHELRNPLAPLSNGLEVLGRTLSMPDAIRATHAMMARQLAHMGQLIDDLLDVSRIAHGKIDLELQRLPLHRILGTAIETVQPMLDRAGQKIDLTVATTTQEIEGDPMRLTQVFGNLLNNASRFSPSGATITIDARNVGNVAEISIADSGAGVPPEHLSRILELFWQVPAAEGGMPRGLGIGLSLSNTLVALHGGSLTLHSKGLGHGTTALVRIPCALTTASTLDASLASKPLGAIPTRRFLVVDDNIDAAQSLVVLLRMEGHYAECVDSGESALERADREAPDVVILDIGMPGMDGFEVCRRLRQTPAGASMLIVALSGWGDADYRQRSQQAGFNAHFVKPLSEKDLARVLALSAPVSAARDDRMNWTPAVLSTVTVDVQSGVARVDGTGRELQ